MRRAKRRPYRTVPSGRTIAPHAGAARRKIVAASWVMAGGLVTALVLYVVADPYAAPLARACTGTCRAVALQVTRFGEGWETLLPATLVLLGCFVSLWQRWPVGERLSRLAWVMGCVLIAVGGSGLLAWLLKNAIGRARPLVAETSTLLLHPFAFHAKWAAFPSGHATTAGATAMVLALLFPKRALLLFIGFAIVAVSRVVVGAHFPSDVAAGFALGAACTLLVAAAFLQRGRVFQLCGGRVWRLPVITPPCAAAGIPRPDRRSSRQRPPARYAGG